MATAWAKPLHRRDKAPIEACRAPACGGSASSPRPACCLSFGQPAEWSAAGAPEDEALSASTYPPEADPGGPRPLPFVWACQPSSAGLGTRSGARCPAAPAALGLVALAGLRRPQGGLATLL